MMRRRTNHTHLPHELSIERRTLVMRMAWLRMRNRTAAYVALVELLPFFDPPIRLEDLEREISLVFAELGGSLRGEEDPAMMI